jgi:hypothetical protein
LDKKTTVESFVLVKSLVTRLRAKKLSIDFFKIHGLR